mgnify:CR=1 FL=1
MVADVSWSLTRCCSGFEHILLALLIIVLLLELAKATIDGALLS